MGDWEGLNVAVKAGRMSREEALGLKEAWDRAAVETDAVVETLVEMRRS